MRTGLRSLVVQVVGVAFSAGLVASVAPPAAAQTVEELTVTARPQHLPESVSYRVGYADIDLSTPEGQTELTRRVRVAANYICGQVNSGLEVAPCVTNSLRVARRAQAQATRNQPHPFQAGPTWVAPPGQK